MAITGKSSLTSRCRYFRMGSRTELKRQTLSLIPAGGSLPGRDWDRRHRALVILLWATIVVLPVYTVIAGGYSAWHAVGHVAVLVPFALLAGVTRLGRKARAALASLGLLTAAGLLVHISHGLIEAHFAFFVLIVLLTLYEDWLIFGIAVAFVLVHHGALGAIDPEEVFNRPEQWAAPWKWAGIHAMFVAGAGIAGIVAWRLNEDVRGRMRETQDQLARVARTDLLTGLDNRRGLMEDLEERLAATSASTPIALTILDLNGFKTYNDGFGHLAGDALLRRLGTRLGQSVPAGASAYRLGGDEFCVLAPGVDAPTAIELAAAAALSEHGEGFRIGAASGSAVLPAEAKTAEAALRLADQRMYAFKHGGRPPAGAQSRDVLLQVVAERDPRLGHHLGGVGDMAEAVAERMDVAAEEIEQIRQAAQLHDVGKIALPDAILNKPGPLSAEEWAFMQRHTIIGERIISAASALTGVAGLVRSSH